MAQFLLQIMLIAAYLAAHVVVVIVAVGIAMWLQGSVEWLIAKVNDPPHQIRPAQHQPLAPAYDFGSALPIFRNRAILRAWRKNKKV
jgi:predicted benzoate:H+ symporter BenE